MNEEETARLFIGVPLAAELLPVVQRAQAEVRGLAGARLMTADQLHVTLAFIGAAGRAKRAAAAAVVEGIPADLGGSAWLGGLLPLPSPARARVISLAIEDRDAVFARLFESVMGGLESADVMQREKRPFRPHLTIARLRPPTAVQLRYECGLLRFAVSSVCLYRSELRRSGAVYTVLAQKLLHAPSQGSG